MNNQFLASHSGQRARRIGILIALLAPALSASIGSAAVTGQSHALIAPIPVTAGGELVSEKPGADHGNHLPPSRAGIGDDDDGDGLLNFADNCLDAANPDQLDTDGDGYGNLCDGDFNNDGYTNISDLAQIKQNFLATGSLVTDMNGDLVTNFLDVGLFSALFLSPPGPSGMSCAGTAPCPEPRFVMEWPMGGRDASDWVINNYVDLQAGAGVLDYAGGGKTYDGHRGIDIDVPTFRAMDNDFPILASAQGAVIDWGDGNFDRNMSCVGSWNFVTLGHPNGWTTTYGHLKKDSVVVQIGDIVEPGDVLGVVGSSGCSTAPHLHLETRDESNNVIEPFQLGLFSDPPVYDTPFGFMDAALYATQINNANMIKDPPPNIGILPPGSTFGIGLSMAGGAAGDVIGLELFDPSDQSVFGNNINFGQVYRHSYWWWNPTLSGNADHGDYTLEIRLNGQLKKTYTVHVGPVLGGFQQARHGIPAADYQTEFDDIAANGFCLEWVDGYEVNGSNYFNAIFSKSCPAPWVAFHGNTGAEYQDLFDDLTGDGYRLTHIDMYPDNGSLLYAGVFVQQGGTLWAAYHGASVADHQNIFNSLTGLGYRPKIISSAEIGGTQYLTALYDQDPVGGFVALANLSPAAYQTEFDTQLNAGRELAYLDGYTLGGSPYLSAIWTDVGPGSWVAIHNATGAEYQDAFDTWTGQGLLTRIVTGYENNNTANFGGMWSD